MNLLYIGYWGIEDPLTRSTIDPHLEVLRTFHHVDRIFLVTIERGNKPVRKASTRNKIIHCPLSSRFNRLPLIGKVLDFVLFQLHVSKVVRSEGIELIVARGALAGSLAYLVWRRTRVPFIVESFEPHAAYMLESGVWSRLGMRYQMQRVWEKRQQRAAVYLAPVSLNYLRHLERNGVPGSKLVLLPCTVDTQLFRFSVAERRRLRNELNYTDDAVVGVYVGKFGDIYLGSEAFDVFERTYCFFSSSFHILILTGQDPHPIRKELERRGVANYTVRYVPHDEVPGMLSAADFAFSLVRPSPSKQFCSPIKNGEYWANGLPILSTRGIGDDSRILEESNVGATFSPNDEESLRDALIRIGNLVRAGREELNESVAALASKHRGRELIRQAYNVLLGVN